MEVNNPVVVFDKDGNMRDYAKDNKGQEFRADVDWIKKKYGMADNKAEVSLELEVDNKYTSNKYETDKYNTDKYKYTTDK